MKFSTRTINYLFILYLVSIILFSTVAIGNNIKINKVKLIGIRFDYLFHVMLFIPWMVLERWRWQERKGLEFYLLALVAGLLLASISEGVQYILPYRSFNVFDLLSNCVGVVIGALIVGWGGAKRQARQKTL